MKLKRKIAGWVTIIAILSLISVWSYWGINEAFHEGWYFTSFFQNLALTFFQYLSVPIILILVSLIAINFRKTGSGLFLAIGIFSLFFFDSPAGRFLIFLPLLLFSLGFYYGKINHKKLLSYILIGVPLLIIITFGIPQLMRVEGRFNDNDFGTRAVVGNDVELTWAPRGEGFPLQGKKWQNANDICALLDENGTGLEDKEMNIWRLPSRDEIVRSMTKDNINSGGSIDKQGVAQYNLRPDKETPLWDPHSKVIYYWTSESADDDTAYLVAYNGIILTRKKDSGADYQGYRCVKG